MINLNPATVQSVVRSVGLIAGGALVYAGFASQTSVADVVQKAVDAAPVVIQAISVLGSLALAVSGMISHSDRNVVQAAVVADPAAIVKAASNVDGVASAIRIADDAPHALQVLANDDSVPNVRPESAFPPSGRR